MLLQEFYHNFEVMFESDQNNRSRIGNLILLGLFVAVLFAFSDVENSRSNTRSHSSFIEYSADINSTAILPLTLGSPDYNITLCSSDIFTPSNKNQDFYRINLLDNISELNVKNCSKTYNRNKPQIFISLMISHPYTGIDKSEMLIS